MAKIGGLSSFANLTRRKGPSFVSTPYCSFSAAHLALHGILAALIERESSGLGQRVDTTLLQGVAAHDPGTGCSRPSSAATTRRTRPAGLGRGPAGPQLGGDDAADDRPLRRRSLDAVLADDRQALGRLPRRHRARVDHEGRPAGRGTGERGHRGARRVLGPRVGRRPVEDLRRVARGLRCRDRRVGRDLRTARSCSTTCSWSPTIMSRPSSIRWSARSSNPALSPPSTPPRRASTAPPPPSAPPAGNCRSPGPAKPGGRWRGRAAAQRYIRGGTPRAAGGDDGARAGTFFAAPFGATILAELGARVIKLEQLEGDPVRHVMPFPELSG